MKRIKYARRAFVRQRGANDCGLACLCMVLNYAGLASKALELRGHGVFAEQGANLADLKKIGGEHGLNAICVRLDAEYLREIGRPLILHTVNNDGLGHFQVCFGIKRKRGEYFYWMADPARQIYLIAERDLLRLWPTRAALYFDKLDARAGEIRPAWSELLHQRFFPRAFWIGIPLLNACVALLSLALSSVLQRGMTGSLGNYQASLMIPLVILLFMVMMFKICLSYLKDIVLISLNKMMNKMLTGCFIKYLVEICPPDGNACARDFVHLGFSEIQKIQQAVSAFVAILLADGALVIVCLCALLYMAPVAAIINSCHIAVALALTLYGLPKAAFERAHLRQLSGAVTEKPALKHPEFLDCSENLAVLGLRRKLLIDCLGAANVSAVFAYGLLGLRRDIFTYNTFLLLVIISYLIASLIPKIVGALYELSDGAEAFRQYDFRVWKGKV